MDRPIDIVERVIGSLMRGPITRIEKGGFLLCRGMLPEYLWMNVPEAFLWPFCHSKYIYDKGLYLL
ncbi:hypothetical protein DRO47_04680 [Candidatus Bathyarchaeota archaeon]|nr:MAG: hypothetical protein DRO47_04680 [Candidatus Bathyarchaeota archaeon]